MGKEPVKPYLRLWRESFCLEVIDVILIDVNRKVNLNAMRLGPGKHLHGRTLFDGVVKGEEFDYFQWVSMKLPLCFWGWYGFKASWSLTKNWSAVVQEATATVLMPVWSSVFPLFSTLEKNPWDLKWFKKFLTEKRLLVWPSRRPLPVQMWPAWERLLQSRTMEAGWLMERKSGYRVVCTRIILWVFNLFIYVVRFWLHFLYRL